MLAAVTAAIDPEHEGAVGGGHGVVLAVLIGGCTHEGDGTGYLIAMRVGENVRMGPGGPHIVDPQVEGSDGYQLVKGADHGEPGGVVEQCRDDSAVDDTGFRIADQLIPIRNFHDSMISAQLDQPEAQRPCVGHAVQHQMADVAEKAEGGRRVGVVLGHGLKARPGGWLLRAGPPAGPPAGKTAEIRSAVLFVGIVRAPVSLRRFVVAQVQRPE